MRDSILATPYAYPDYESVYTPVRSWVDIVNESISRVPGDNWKEKLDHCVSCRCCERHQVDKPDKLTFWYEISYKGRDFINKNCKCDCRHMARFICRQVEDPMPICPLINPVSETEA